MVKPSTAVSATALEMQLPTQGDEPPHKSGGPKEPGWWGEGRDQSLFPESEDQARGHIEWIRSTRNLDKPDANARALHAVLKQTAGRLYSNSTHFLLELVQNADDNQYNDGVVPSATFTYQHGDQETCGTLRIDSNERGFSSANVQSICSAGESTKADSDSFSDPEAERIGEKGVGFKAVFDVAHTVWIASGHYQFKFINTEDEILGIITPRWAPFPQPRIADHTSIVMDLLPDYNPKRLVDALRSLDPSILLFLNRLWEIKVEIRELNKSPWSISFRKEGPSLGKAGMSIASIHHGDASTSYYVYGKTLHQEGLAPDKRRKGAASSHMQLVFPFQSFRAGEQSRDLPTQSLFAFLPVWDYGLKFIIQADFLLVTSRERIDECPWNEALIANIPDLFVEAVTELNKLGKTYAWLPFIPLGPYQDRLLDKLPTETLARLSRSPVLESNLGKLAIPSSLTFAPNEFRDASKAPLLPSDGANITYVSDNYPDDCQKILNTIGVATLSGHVFLVGLENYIRLEEPKFRKMTKSWHCELAKALYELVWKDNHWGRLQKLRLAPVLGSNGIETPAEDCDWLSTNSGYLVLSTSKERPRIPTGIGMFEIHQDVVQDQWGDRRRLLSCIGANYYNAEEVCNRTITKHADDSFHPQDQTLGDLVSHVRFLKATNWRPTSGKTPPLWFATTRNSRCLGTDLYIDVESRKKPFSASAVFRRCRDKFNFLHESYAKHLGADCMAYLMKSFGLEMQPRMASLVNPETSGYELSKDIRYLAGFDSDMLLQLLRHSWKVYNKWFVEDSAVREGETLPNRESVRQMRDELSRVKVRCVGGSMDELRNTFIPRRNVSLGLKTTAGTNLRQSGNPIIVRDSRESAVGEEEQQHTEPRNSKTALDVEDPEHQGWDFLETFGVVVKVDVGVFLSHLQQLRESTHVTKANVAAIYELIENAAEEKDYLSIRNLFATESLVFLHSEDGPGNEKRWTTSRGCVWRGPSCMKKTPRLKLLYPSMKNFFIEIIGCLAKAGFEHRAREILMIDEGYSLRDINELFRAMVRRLPYRVQLSSQAQALRLLRHARIFPTRRGLGNTEAYRLSAAGDEDEWFIPDDPRPSGVFADKLNFLVLDQGFLTKTFFELLGLSHRLLSVAARCEPVADDQSRTGGHLYGRWLRKRIRFVIALIPTSIPNRQEKIRKLEGMKFRRADVIRMQWAVEGFGKRLTVPTESAGNAALIENQGALTLYMVDFEPRNEPDFDDAATEVATYCGIQDPQRSILLRKVLKERDRKQAEMGLEKFGFIFSPERPEHGHHIDEHPSLEDIEARDGYREAVKPAETKTMPGEEADDILSRLEVKTEEIDNPGPRPRPNEDVETPKVKTESATAFTMAQSDTTPPPGPEPKPKTADTLIPGDGIAGLEGMDGLETLQSTEICVKSPLSSTIKRSHIDKAGHDDGRIGSKEAGVKMAEKTTPEKIRRLLSRGNMTPEKTEKLASEKVRPKKTSSPRSGEAKPKQTNDSTTKESKSRNRHSPAPHGIKTGKIDNATAQEGIEVFSRKPDKTDKVVPNPLTAEANTAREVSHVYESAEKTHDEVGQDKPEMDRKNGHLAEGEHTALDDEHPPDNPLIPVGTLQTRASWAPGAPTGSDHESADDTEEDLISDRGQTLSGSRRNSTSTDGGSEVSVHEKSRSSQLKWEATEDADSDDEQPEETAEKVETPEGPRDETPKEQCKTEQARWQAGRVFATVAPVNSTKKGSRANDEGLWRAQGGTDDFLNISKGYITAPPTVTISVGGQDKQHTTYAGELFVSRYLEHILGKDVYDPDKHWTSPLRARNGHTKFRPETMSEDVSTFTIDDKSGKLQGELGRSGSGDLKQLSGVVEFHIQVVTTKESLTSYFDLSNQQYQKMRRMSLRRGKRYRRAYILATVHGISRVPGVAMFVDPWYLMEKEAISLESRSDFVGKIRDSSCAAINQEYNEVIETRKDRIAIYQGFDLDQGQIRVIKLDLLKETKDDAAYSNVDGQPLTGSFEVVDGNDPPPYWAISYVWGPTPTGPNAYTFQTAQGKISITESLAGCLKSLRRKGVEAFVWVDALCINQSDNAEKGIQIRSLGSVYRKSEKVIVWMGETGLRDESSPGIDWLQSVHAPTCKPTGWCDMSTDSGPGLNRWDARWNDVTYILQQEWFVRTWIIQELVLGKNISIVYGQSEIGWDCFMASLSVGGDEILEQATPAIALHLTRQKHRKGHRFKFLELLELFSYTHASEPRDKLFAHLSMAYDVEESTFDPDYSSRVERVLEKYAKGLVENKRALELLYWAGMGKSTGFCSWIPDFLHDGFARTISTWEGGEHGFHAGKHRPAVAKVLSLKKITKDALRKSRPNAHAPPVLKIAGHIIGTVDGCHPLRMGNTDREITFPKAYADIREYAASIEGSYRSSGTDSAFRPRTVDEMMLRTLIGDARGPRTRSDWAVRFGQTSATANNDAEALWPPGFERTILELELGEDGHRSLNKPAESRGLMTAYWQTAAAFTRRIPKAAFVTVLPARTDEQPLYAGIAPGRALAGDVVFVANNARVPFVLRRQGDQDFFVLVGECYLDGIMYGPPAWVERESEISVYIV